MTWGNQNLFTAVTQWMRLYGTLRPLCQDSALSGAKISVQLVERHKT